MHWNETDGIWSLLAKFMFLTLKEMVDRYDYDVGTGKHINKFYLSNALPVYARCYDDDDDQSGPRSLFQYLVVSSSSCPFCPLCPSRWGLLGAADGGAQLHEGHPHVAAHDE